MSALENEGVLTEGEPHPMRVFASDAGANGLARSIDQGFARFAELAALMYAVRRRCPRFALLAASAVNPRHSLPPQHLELLAALSAGGERRGGATGLPSLFALARRALWCLVWAIRDTWSIAGLRLRFGWRGRALRRQPVQVLLKTWCFGVESLHGATDFYYGSLPRLLEERGVSCALLCGDGRGGEGRALAEAALRRTGVRSIPESLLVPLWAPLATVCDQVITSLKLRRLAGHETDGALAMVCAHASLDCLTPATTQNTLHFYIARTAVRAWRPRAFVTFYEGQPWEKPAWHGAKAASPECLTVGYQHTVVMPHSLALLRPNRDSWELATPDVALCLGETTRAMLEPGHEAHGTKLVVFGSFRTRPASVERRAPRPNLQTVLVLPEGILAEAELIFDAATRVAALSPDHRFIFRCHPALPFDRVRTFLGERPEACANIEISARAEIAEDFARASVVLYRGSSSVLYAILHGLKPIYLHVRGHPDVDPLFQMEGWRERASSEDEMASRLRAYALAPGGNATADWRRAVDYVAAYTRPVEAEAIDRFLEAVGLVPAAPVA